MWLTSNVTGVRANLVGPTVDLFERACPDATHIDELNDWVRDRKREFCEEHRLGLEDERRPIAGLKYDERGYPIADRGDAFIDAFASWLKDKVPCRKLQRLH